jgi:hypothetical protein
VSRSQGPRAVKESGSQGSQGVRVPGQNLAKTVTVVRTSFHDPPATPCPPLLIPLQHLHTPLFALLAMCAGAHQFQIVSITRRVPSPSVRCIGWWLAATAVGVVGSHMQQLLSGRLCCDSLQQSPQCGCGVQHFAPTLVTESATVCVECAEGQRMSTHKHSRSLCVLHSLLCWTYPSCCGCKLSCCYQDNVLTRVRVCKARLLNTCNLVMASCDVDEVNGRCMHGSSTCWVGSMHMQAGQPGGTMAQQEWFHLLQQHSRRALCSVLPGSQVTWLIPW